MLKKIRALLRSFAALFGAQDMTVGSPFMCLLKFTVPLLIGNIAQMMYTSADAAVVGNYIGDAALSAIGSSSPPYNFFLVLFMGVGSGVTVMVSQYFGAKDYDNLAKSIGNSITLIAIVSVFITAVATPLTGWMLGLVNTPAETFDMARAYITILFLGAAGNGFYNVLSGVLRGMGESVFPLLVLLATVVLNIGLDILFVAGFNMGIAGAAWATIISQVLSATACLIKIMTMRNIVKIKPAMLRPRSRITRQIIKLGFPAAISMSIMFASSIIVQSLINKMGYMVAAAITTTMRLDGFAVLPSQTFSMAAGTFTGQNVGAGKMDRVQQGSRTVLLMCLVFTVVMVLCMQLFGRYLLLLFTSTESLIDMCMTFIRIMIPAYLAMVVSNSRAGVMRGAGDQMGPMWISLFINVILRVPLSYIIAYFTRSDAYPNGNPNSIFIALMAAMLAGCVINTLYYRAGKWRGKSIIGAGSEPAV